MPLIVSASACQAFVLLLLVASLGAAGAQPNKAGLPAAAPAAKAGALTRLTHAVEGAESSYGANPRMWRADPAAPQGPMQVTAAAAADVGGGDRFDSAENLTLGRAYLAHMYRRFGSWPDAVAAYNWGPGNLDFWIRRGRLPLKMPPGVERYRNRVLAAAELPLPAGAYLGAGFGPIPRRTRLLGIAHAQPRRIGIAARPSSDDAAVASLYGQLMQASTPGAN